MSFDYVALKRQMALLAETAQTNPTKLESKVSDFLRDKKRLPPECAELIFWVLTCNLDFTAVARHFDWYRLSDVYQKLIVEHDNVPRTVLEYIQKFASLESDELADLLWFAQLCRLAVQNAWQLSYTERLELFRSFVENMTVYAAHTIQPAAWNDEDIYLFSPELRLTYHVNQAYVRMEKNDLEGYAKYLDLAAEDCPDLQSCTDALKTIPERKESPLEGMTQTQIQDYAIRRVAEIKQTFQNEDWLKTAELIKAFDRDGFEAQTDFELLNIQCRLARRGLLW